CPSILSGIKRVYSFDPEERNVIVRAIDDLHWPGHLKPSNPRHKPIRAHFQSAQHRSAAFIRNYSVRASRSHSPQPSPQPERFRWRLVVPRVEIVFCMKKTTQPLTGSTHQTVLKISTARSSESIRIGFTDQRLTAYGGMALWSSFLHK